MAENDRPDREGKVDPSENPDNVTPAEAQGQGAIGGGDDKDVNEQKKEKPGESGKGINPVQHSE
jgi:hypothetical protein